MKRIKFCQQLVVFLLKLPCSPDEFFREPAHLPTLIVWGDRDTIIPVEHAYEAHEAIPDSRLEVIEGAGHFPHVECPDEFLDVLLDFLDTTEPAEVDMAALRELLLDHTEAPSAP